MALTSALRVKPYRHAYQSLCLLPGTCYVCEIFPSLIRIFDYSLITPEQVATIAINPAFCLDHFVVTCDLERGSLVISSGKCRLEISKATSKKAVHILAKNLLFTLEGIKLGERADFLVARERLYLGCDKAQDWDLIVRRENMAEILPIWYMLSQSIAPPVDSLSLFDLSQLKRLFLVGFTGMFVPQREDSRFLGIEHDVKIQQDVSVLQLLKETRPLIRRLFFEESLNSFHFLLNLPSEFHAGSLSPIFTSRGHTLMLEWSKHEVRRLSIKAGCDDRVTLSFSKGIKHFRLRHSKHERGGCILSNESTVELQKDASFLLDNFN